jgi:formylmethanofuran dehydrogenase subunit A
MKKHTKKLLDAVTRILISKGVDVHSHSINLNVPEVVADDFHISHFL